MSLLLPLTESTSVLPHHPRPTIPARIMKTSSWRSNFEHPSGEPELLDEHRCGAADSLELRDNLLTYFDREKAAERSGGDNLTRLHARTPPELICQDDDRQERIDEGMSADGLDDGFVVGAHSHPHRGEVDIAPILQSFADDEGAVGDVVGIGLDHRGAL